MHSTKISRSTLADLGADPYIVKSIAAKIDKVNVHVEISELIKQCDGRLCYYDLLWLAFYLGHYSRLDDLVFKCSLENIKKSLPYLKGDEIITGFKNNRALNKKIWKEFCDAEVLAKEKNDLSALWAIHAVIYYYEGKSTSNTHDMISFYSLSIDYAIKSGENIKFMINVVKKYLYQVFYTGKI